MKAVLSALVLGIILIAGCKPVGIEKQVKKVRSSVVHIEKVGEWQGSGFIISEDGIIATAKHVVDGGGTFVVTLDDGTKYTTDIAISYRSSDVGFLVIKADKPLPAVTFSNVSVQPGQPVFIMGSPLGFENFNSVTLGIISAKHRDLDEKHNEGYGWSVTFQSDSAAYPGNSGGPVFNINGEVVGVLVAGFDASLNFSIPTVVFTHKIGALKNVVASVDFQIVEPPKQQNDEPNYLEMINELQNQINDLQNQLNSMKEFYNANGC